MYENVEKQPLQKYTLFVYLRLKYSNTLHGHGRLDIVRLMYIDN
jgi:hypothetical protein